MWRLLFVCFCLPEGGKVSRCVLQRRYRATPPSSFYCSLPLSPRWNSRVALNCEKSEPECEEADEVAVLGCIAIFSKRLCGFLFLFFPCCQSFCLLHDVCRLSSLHFASLITIRIGVVTVFSFSFSLPFAALFSFLVEIRPVRCDSLPQPAKRWTPTTDTIKAAVKQRVKTKKNRRRSTGERKSLQFALASFSLPLVSQEELLRRVVCVRMPVRRRDGHRPGESVIKGRTARRRHWGAVQAAPRTRHRLRSVLLEARFPRPLLLFR
ncbi:hypothetical protein ABB37_06495 [Leptomonas pyrrhocoris]|uniref:Uncharacterized protein n=1 Tax=Leptomonas pyrrhocoris TaxID=157538 RepID=A0A0N0VEI2_LEPPY|nr:hypothetical protein ABB37_06495 [Leptomonas pyrrhocoris]KPA78378.1 hypothetical protein ABB37_06495 [Leptomonas pyrrhocoris]|eukprot:XP_015656817.1 hypothetical protein ABB37_06495 [Leptomonas pyrrhocoris]